MNDNINKVRVAAMKVSFLMQHQKILPDLRDFVSDIYPLGVDPDQVNYNSPEYLLGAYDALMNLIACLEQKG